MAHKLGITSELQGVPAEALGGTSTCCTVLEMSNAYATLANGGVHHDPTAIRKVVFPNGDVDEPENPEGTRVISDGVAYTVADVMEGTLDFGTAAGYDLPGCTASGKTGTTEEQSDAWFVGYTPDVSTAVWTGNPDRPDAAARLRRRSLGADLERLHDGRGDRRLPRLPGSRRIRPTSRPTRAAPPRRRPTYDTTSTTTPRRPGAPTTAPPAGADTDGDGYPDDAYAPGIQETTATAATVSARRRRRRGRPRSPAPGPRSAKASRAVEPLAAALAVAAVVDLAAAFLVVDDHGRAGPSAR